MTITILSDKDAFTKMRQSWNELLAASPANSVYLTWEWLFTWWEVFGEARQLHIILVKDDSGKFAAIAPLIIHERSLPFGLKEKVLEFLGTGEDQSDEVCSNYMDFIVAVGQESTLELIFDEILKGFQKNLWGRMELNSVPKNSKLESQSNTISKGPLTLKISQPDACAVINLPHNWQEYLVSLKRGWRYQIKKGREELATRGDVVCEDYKTFPDIQRAMVEFIAIHQERWHADGKPGAFASQKHVEFHSMILERFSPSGWCGVRLLKLNGRTMAGSYRFLYNQTVYFYQSAFDHTRDSKIGLGMLERSYDIEEAIKAGYKYYDFYKAKPGSYKWHFAKDQREVCDVRIFKKNLSYWLMRGINFSKKIKNASRRFYRGSKK